MAGRGLYAPRLLAKRWRYVWRCSHVWGAAAPSIISIFVGLWVLKMLEGRGRAPDVQALPKVGQVILAIARRLIADMQRLAALLTEI